VLNRLIEKITQQYFKTLVWIWILQAL